jgi:hypothetical protein
MLGDKKNKQSLQGQLSNNWHKKEVSTLMDHFQGDTKEVAWFRSISGDDNAGRGGYDQEQNVMSSNSLMTIPLHQWRTACITDNPLSFRDQNATAKGQCQILYQRSSQQLVKIFMILLVSLGLDFFYE